jgi:Nucleotidyl transferase AbiEii toxin, Type IV TA system
MAALGDLHRQVAAIALAAAAEHGFALGGGNALLAHGLTMRPTQDVDLFTDREDGVEAAAAAVEAALAAAGLQAERQDDTADLADLFPGMARGWPSGPSQLRTASRPCCRWLTSTEARRRSTWRSARSSRWKT